MERKNTNEFNQEILDLYDDYAHGRMTRRDYIKRLGVFALGGLTVEALLTSLSPNYAWAQQVKADDPRIKTETITYKSITSSESLRFNLTKGIAIWP